MSDDLKVPPEPNFPIPKIINPINFTEDRFSQFMFIVYYTNPTRDSVRLILDDGSIKVWIKRDKFLKLMSDILNETLLYECQVTLYRIKESLSSYGKIYYYNRVRNHFEELMEVADFEKIRPQELLEESRKPLEQKTMQDNFNKVNKQYNEEILNKISFSPPEKLFNKVVSVITKDFAKRKKKTL